MIFSQPRTRTIRQIVLPHRLTLRLFSVPEYSTGLQFGDNIFDHILKASRAYGMGDVEAIDSCLIDPALQFVDDCFGRADAM